MCYRSSALHYATPIDLVCEDRAGRLCLVEIKSVVHSEIKKPYGRYRPECRALAGTHRTKLLDYHIQVRMCARVCVCVCV